MWSVVTESPSTASTRAPRMSATGAGSARQALEERRPRDVRRRRVPGIPVARRDRAARASARRPRRRSRRCAGRAPVRPTRRSSRRISSLLGQMSASMTGWPSRSTPERLAASGRCRRDRRARRRRPAAARRGSSPCQRMDAALEVAVARQDGGARRGRAPRRPSRPARRAARCCRCRSCSRSPTSVEAERLEGRHEAGAREVLGHRARPGREARLDGRADREAARDRVPGEQARARP